MRWEGVVERLGFYTTRFLRGDDAADVSQRVIHALHAELEPRLLNTADDRPTLIVEEVEEVDEVNGPTAGFTFYRDVD